MDICVPAKTNFETITFARELGLSPMISSQNGRPKENVITVHKK